MSNFGGASYTRVRLIHRRIRYLWNGLKSANNGFKPHTNKIQGCRQQTVKTNEYYFFLIWVILARNEFSLNLLVSIVLNLLFVFFPVSFSSLSSFSWYVTLGNEHKFNVENDTKWYCFKLKVYQENCFDRKILNVVYISLGFITSMKASPGIRVNGNMLNF